jgi:tetratricopeptide (TPR) repeat protein
MRLALILLTLTVAFPAAAEDKDAARKAYSEGSRYYNLGQYGEALESFKRAYWSYEEPSFLYNIAQCHRALKHKSEAIEFYRSYLRTAPATPKRSEVEHLIAELEAALAQERAVARLSPEGPLSAPATTATSPAPSEAAALTASAPESKSHKPVWKRAWFWGVMAGAAVVVAGVAVGIGVGTSTTKDPSPSFGKVSF